MTCHIHPGTNMVTTYYGYTWWDNETDGEKMYPAKQHDPSRAAAARCGGAQSGGLAPRGKLERSEVP
jgi:hypothetical protein